MLSCALVACAPTPRHGNGGDDDSNPDGNNGGDGNSDCSGDAKLIYTIDQFNGALLSQFDPATKTFTDLGPLSCPTQPGATTFSMGVDRNVIGWVLYDTGELFRVDILNNRACTKTSWHAQNGLTVFGMGFSTDMPMGSTDTLFVGGGMSQTQTSFTLAKIDTTTMMSTVVGSEPQLPEMTGNAKAELWGFFPDASQPKVVRFDKTTGAAAVTFPEPQLAGTMTGYAFAHWGGDYWVFLIKNGEPSTTVYQIDGMTGMQKGTTPTTGRTIVGAGVSTCAPVVIF